MGRRDGRAPLDHALNDGEDFELCLVVAPEEAARLRADPPSPARLHLIGTSPSFESGPLTASTTRPAAPAFTA